MVSVALACAVAACDGDHSAVFDSDPQTSDAGTVVDSGADASTQPLPTADAGDADVDPSEPLDGGDGGPSEDADADTSEPVEDGGDGGPAEDADASDGAVGEDDAGLVADAGADAPNGDGGTACLGPDDCDDGIACTIDVCDNGVCRHTLAAGSGPWACPVGSYCDPTQGCVTGTVCATNAHCVDALGSDPCKTDIYCHSATATCQFTLLDKDEDGDPPIACGGSDCNDTDPYNSGSQPEICDGKDNDCDGLVDEDDVCLVGCDIAACPEPPGAGISKCCTNDGKCGFKEPTSGCFKVEEDTCGLASCPEVSGMLKCCTGTQQCGFKTSLSGVCWDHPSDTCGLASCPVPDTPDFQRCCTHDDKCGFQHGPTGYCYANP